MSDVVIESVLTCPHCGFAAQETMPTNACQFFHDGRNCKTLLRPKPGNCCVFCSFGSVPCPPGTGATWMLRLTALVMVMTAVSGCSWQQAYSSAQGWQRNQCNRLVDQTERERCLANASMTYDEYRSRGEGTKKE